MEQKKRTCADRVGAAFESRAEDIRCMLDLQRDDVTLGDDGTLDTVLWPGSLDEVRLDSCSEYRDDRGELDLDALLDDRFGEIRDECADRFFEYGLSFDYVFPGTFSGQREAYYRYQLSWGGPSEEFRFFVNDGVVYRVEFWYLDWYDGAHVIVTDDPRVELLSEYFDGACMFSREGH